TKSANRTGLEQYGTDWTFESGNSPLARTPILRTWLFISIIYKGHDEHLATMEDIISRLQLLPVIEKRLQEYYPFSQVALVPETTHAAVDRLYSSWACSLRLYKGREGR
ncbi:hypothetical protein N7470_007943, partial [Penicillium chermesinum]